MTRTHLEAVLVGARGEVDIVATQPTPTSVCVGKHAGEHVADVRGTVDVEYRGGDKNATLRVCQCWNRFPLVEKRTLHEVGDEAAERRPTE